MKVKIIIPIYKQEFTYLEKISFEQCLKILKNYTIVIVHPSTLDVTKFVSLEGVHIENESFDDKYFENVEGYNKLMLSEVFYNRFEALDYMLIYQLDCYVFKDELLYWCKQGYDYIGAPWIFRPSLLNKIKKTLNEDKYIIWYKTGNGGFSLRRVESSLKIVKELKKEIDVYPHNEDVFWSLEVPKYYPDFIIPKYDISVSFAIDRKPKIAFKLNQNQLPFGCHGINKPKVINFWKEKLKF